MTVLRLFGTLWIGLLLLIGGCDKNTGITSGAGEPSEITDNPIFPQAASLVIPSGASEALGFRATMDWDLTVTDGEWCHIRYGIQTAQHISGNAGDVAFTVTVNDTGWHSHDEITFIELSMGGKTEAIFEITRPGMEETKVPDPVAAMYTKDEGGNVIHIEEALLIYGRSLEIPIGFTANFRWKVFTVPDGFHLSDLSEGPADDEPTADGFTLGKLSLDLRFTNSAVSGDIIVSDLTEEYKFRFPVTYTGMGNEISLLPGSILTEGIAFTADGFVVADGSPTTANSFVFSVLAQDNRYSLIITEADPNGNLKETDGQECWLSVSDDGNGTVCVSSESNQGDERALSLFVLPAELAENTDENSLPTEYNQIDKYCIAVSQEGFSSASRGFFVGWGDNATAVSGDKILPMEDVWGDPSQLGMGLPDKSYVYSFNGADIDGTLTVYPTGVSPTVFAMRFPGTDTEWSQVSAQGTIREGIYQVQLVNMASVPAGSSTVLVFYETHLDMMLYRNAVAALALARTQP